MSLPPVRALLVIGIASVGLGVTAIASRSVGQVRPVEGSVAVSIGMVFLIFGICVLGIYLRFRSDE